MCDGNAPCQACTIKGRDCQRVGTDMRGRWRAADHVSAGSKGLASRMSRVERQLGLVKEPERRRRGEPDQTHGESIEGLSPHQRRENGSVYGSSTRNPSPQLQVPAFSGETSIAHNLTVVEGRLEQMGVQYKRLRSASPSQRFTSRLTPSPNESSDLSPEQQTGLIQKVLDAHRIAPNRRQWDSLMHTFCDEVHILVPFLHLPSLWKLYDDLWRSGFGRQSDGQLESGSHRVRTAHILLGIANGRCVESSRLEEDQGSYSAGWSLYSAARDMFGDLIDGFRQCEDQILVLQTVMLMVVYLFRLDAHGSAEKILALAISHAHHLGLQRERVVSAMSPFQSQMARRLWWCIYLLDRRLAIETGRPFLIQDINVDVGLPDNVSDEWLTTHKTTQLATRVNMSDKEGISTSVPYLIAMTSYSKVIGKVWEALYGATTSEATTSPLLNEYLEHLTTQSQKGLQKEFTHDPYHEDNYNSEGLAWWQVKQHLMMRIRWCSLYLLIRKPMLQKVRCNNDSLSEAVENEVICMRLAQRIIDDFRNVPEEHPKYTFPFLHYLTSATIIALGLIIKQPSFKSSYGALTLRATKSLWEHCRKTWMSGKMVQTVWKLNQIADAILSSHDSPSDRTSRFGGSVSTLLPAAGLVQSTPNDERNPPKQYTTVNPTIRPPLYSSQTPIGARNYAHVIDNNHILSEPEAGAIPGATEPQNHQRNDTTQARAGAAASMLDFVGGRRPALRNDSSHRPEDFPYPTGHMHCQAEAYFETRGCMETRDGRDHGASSSQIYDTVPFEMGLDAPLPGESINGGMEWLQSLFSNGLDSQILPVWD
ncbi:hypothetical protein PENSUB_3463 [Penicillium subrubescens]|uniref:Xylanolytic transcriptional activator regulatory domain-containing protein n=1 Tax=Penicillium subrubescens TaxID=1316194 RepID=A0A1Q5UF56_9EURO|nr:hypothetical protein PENSUB_3463 [Penicillium subrubescens]